MQQISIGENLKTVCKGSKDGKHRFVFVNKNDREDCNMLNYRCNKCGRIKIVLEQK